MGKAEREKGARGEREVATILRAHGLDVRRVPNSGGLDTIGDLLGLDCYHLEVKRQERLALPAWIAQAADECGDKVPVVVFRQSRGQWYACLPLGELANLLRPSQVYAP